MLCILYQLFCLFLYVRLSHQFKTVFPYKNKVGRLIIDTEKAHSIKHCHVDVTNYANPINCCCDGPEGGHKINVHQQGLRKNQGVNSAITIMTHSLNREASQLLCDAMTCQVENGDASAENWKDSSARALAPDRFWNQTMASMIASDNAGPCLGIELNIWERAKVGIHFNYFVYTLYISYITYVHYFFL